MNNLPPSRIVQLNIARSSARTHIMLNHLTDTHILLLQEPWYGRIGLDKADTSPEGRPINGFTASQAWESFAPLAPGCPKVATYVKHNVAGLKATPRPDIAKHPNLLPVEITYGGSTFLTVNVYNGGNGAKAEAVTMLSFLPLSPAVPTVVAGDFNLHHSAWSIPPSANQQSAEDLLEWATDNLFFLANPRGVRTRLGADGQRDSIIDLVFINRAAVDMSMFSAPIVDENLSFGSDHNAIVYTAQLPPPVEEDSPSDLGKRLDPEKQQEWSAEFSARIREVTAGYRNPETAQELDQLVDRLVECYVQATNACMPDCKPIMA